MFYDRRTPGDPLDPSPFYTLVDPGLREMPECYNSLGFDFFADVGDIFFAFRHLPPEAVVEILLFSNFLQAMRISLSATESVGLAQKG